MLTPTQHTLHHWQCAFSAQLPLMLHLLLLSLQTQHLSLAANKRDASCSWFSLIPVLYKNICQS